MTISNEKGMTLTEVLTAMAILGMVVVLFLNISGYSSLAVKRSSDLVDLRTIAEKQLHTAREQIKTTGAVPADEIIDGVNVYYRISDDHDGGAAGSNDPELAMQAIVLLGGQPQWLTVTVSRVEGD